MDADEELHLLAIRIKEAIRELKGRGFPIAELHVGRDVARKLALMVATKHTNNISACHPKTLEYRIDHNNGPFEMGTIGPGVPIICLDRGNDDKCVASFRKMHSD